MILWNVNLSWFCEKKNFDIVKSKKYEKKMYEIFFCDFDKSKKYEKKIYEKKNFDFVILWNLRNMKKNILILWFSEI